MASSVRSRTPHACASPAAGCEAHCAARHPRSGSCAVCGEPWGNHFGHNCPRGGRGAYPLTGPDFSDPDAETYPQPLAQAPREPWGDRVVLCASAPCGGCLGSPDYRIFFFVASITAFPAAFFVAVSAAWLPKAVAALLAGLSVASAAAAVFLDPGVIPAQRLPNPPKAPPRLVGDLTLLPGDEVVVIEGAELVRRWCNTCGLLRPVRASHCVDCNVCVMEYDHHCGVLGACVGLRTFRFFVGFLWITALLCYWVIGWTFMELARTWPPFASQSLPRRERARYQPSTQQVLQVALLVYASLAALFLTLFGVFYCTLTLSNQTERENFRGTYVGGKNPFDKGCIRNWHSRIFGPIPPSALQIPRLAASVPLVDEV
ncbi:putative protein S-acyltransferase 3 [Diplonema papillatum]|nr:putative protein S-acyltransferase 3 [Diplonema papillatum]